MALVTALFRKAEGRFTQKHLREMSVGSYSMLKIKDCTITELPYVLLQKTCSIYTLDSCCSHSQLTKRQSLLFCDRCNQVEHIKKYFVAAAKNCTFNNDII